MIRSGVLQTPWGLLCVEVGELGVRQVRFDAPTGPPLRGHLADMLTAYLHGEALPEDIPVELSHLTPLSQRVLTVCRSIPFGEVVSYAALARAVGAPHAARAVGHALARNPVPILIPCHRVVGANGRLTGFLGGLQWKRCLLQHEGILVSGDRVRSPLCEVKR